jgi:transcription termination factor NusB
MRNTHLDVNGNKGPSINFEQTHYDDIMLGDQMFNHPVMSEISYKLAEDYQEKFDKNILKQMETEYLEKVQDWIKEELDKRDSEIDEYLSSYKGTNKEILKDV